MQGTVKWFDATREYGFIAAADGSADLLLEGRDIVEQFRHLVREGCDVDFRVLIGSKGPQASQVQPVDAVVSAPDRDHDDATGTEPADAPTPAGRRVRCA